MDSGSMMYMVQILVVLFLGSFLGPVRCAPVLDGEVSRCNGMGYSFV